MTSAECKVYTPRDVGEVKRHRFSFAKVLYKKADKQFPFGRSVVPSARKGESDSERANASAKNVQKHLILIID